MIKYKLFIIVICTFFTFHFSLFTFHCKAQVLAWQWGRDAVDQPQGGGMAIAVTKDPSGNLVSTGIIKDSITFGSTLLVNTDTGFSATYVVKYDINGNLLWAKQNGGPGGTITSAIATDLNGNVYV